MQADSRRGAVVFVFVTLLLDMIGFGIVIPVIPKLIEGLTHSDISQAALYGGWLSFSFALAQFFFGPIIGNLSDRFGRRPVLLVSLFVFGIDYLLMAFAPTIGWLFVGRLLSGIAGATHGPATAYIADISKPEDRAKNFGLLGAAFGLGFILGPAIGGVLAAFGPRAPFLAAAALAGCNFIYGYFVLPESLSPSERRPFEWKRAQPFGALVQLMKYPAVLGMIITLFFWQMGHHVLPSTWAFYTQLRFGWSERDIGLSLAFVGVLAAVVQGGLTGVLIARWGESRGVLVGFASAIIGYIGYGLSNSGWLMFVWMAVSALSGLAHPSINAMMSRRVPANAQGELQGAIASLYSITSIIGPVLMTQVFSHFSRPGEVYLPGAAFLLAAVLTVLGSATFFLTIRRANDFPDTTHH